MRRGIDATLSLFPEAELPPPRAPRVPAAAADEPFECVREVLPPAPARPEIESAHYWAEQLRLADSPERKAECHEKMMLCLKACS